jgi:hypothetical protein
MGVGALHLSDVGVAVGEALHDGAVHGRVERHQPDEDTRYKVASVVTPSRPSLPLLRLPQQAHRGLCAYEQEIGDLHVVESMIVSVRGIYLSHAKWMNSWTHCTAVRRISRCHTHHIHNTRTDVSASDCLHHVQMD